MLIMANILIHRENTVVYRASTVVYRENLGLFREKSLLCRLQAQTLPNATPPLGKIPPFTEIAVTLDPMK